MARKKRLTNLTPETFIDQATAMHGDKYDYSNVDWTRRRYDGAKLVGVQCREHGMFFMLPSYHVRGKGCSKCHTRAPVPPRFSIEERITFAQAVHGNQYIYSDVESSKSKDKVTIICPKHGPFKQTWGHHLAGVNCPSCGWKRPMQNAWLDLLKVPKEYREHTLVVDGKTLRVDAYDPHTHTVYEFLGNYWHGDPRDTAFNDGTTVNRVNKRSHSQLVEETASRLGSLYDAGYKVRFIFERDFLKSEDDHKRQTSTRIRRVVHQPTRATSSTIKGPKHTDVVFDSWARP